MNAIILCEGNSDAVLISHYLIHCCGWKRSKYLEVAVPIRDELTESVDWFRRNDDNLAVWAVGGKGNFEYALGHVAQIARLFDQDKIFRKVVVVTDYDAPNTLESLENELSKKSAVPVKFSNGQWTQGTIGSSFGNAVQLSFACIILPWDRNGSIEAFALDALSEDVERKPLIDAARTLVQGIASATYLPTSRKKVKAELGVSLALMFPEKVFIKINPLLASIRWEEYKKIREGFGLFETI